MAKKLKQLPPGTYTNKEYVEYLKKSGLADSIVSSQPTYQEKALVQVWWDLIQAEAKLKRPEKRIRISKEEKTFLSIKDKLPADALTGKLDVFIIYIEEQGLMISRGTAHKIWKKYRSS